MQRQVALNDVPRVARAAQNVVRVDEIVGKLRALRNETIRKIDCRLSDCGGV